MQKIRNLSVEISKIEDYDLSSILFEENFKSIGKDIYTYSWSDINSINDMRNFIKFQYLDDFLDVEDLINSYRFLDEFEDYERLKNEYKNMKEDEINKCIDYALDEYLDDLLYYRELELEEIIYTLNSDLSIDYFEIIETRGYSQGDYAKVLVNTNEFEEFVGIKFDYDIEQKIIDEIFWDAPINFYVKASYQIECKEYSAIQAVDDDFYEIEEVGSSDYYSDWMELEKAVNKIKKEVLEIFNKRYKTSFNEEEVNWKISEELL